MLLSSITNALTVRGERRAQQLRPATLIYAGKQIPCSPGNKMFFQVLKQGVGGFTSIESLFLKMLRSDLPMVPDGKGGEKRIEFKRGQVCLIRNDDPDCPVPGETFRLVIGENNQVTTMVLMLNVESTQA